MVDPAIVIWIIVAALALLTTVIVLLSRYRKCPSDKILVVYGKVGSNRDGTYRSAKCIHGGAAFIVPVFQSYQYLDLTPISISVDLKNVETKYPDRRSLPLYRRHFGGARNHAKRRGASARLEAE